jgi:hypothetical protein
MRAAIVDGPGSGCAVEGAILMTTTDTPDEIGALGAFLMGPDGAFITGSDFLIDGGVTASYFYGDLKPQLTPTTQTGTT